MLFAIMSIDCCQLAQGAPLTLDEALLASASTHPSVTTKKNESAAASSSLETSKWQRFPALSAQSQAGQAGGKSVTSIRIDQPLWTGGRITADIDANTAKVEAAEDGVLEAEQKVLTRTASLFTELVRLQSRLDAADENIAEHQRLLELIERRSAQQVSSPSEVVAAKARLQQAQSERIQLQVSATNTKADLEQVVGHPIAEIKVPKIELTTSSDLPATVDAALQYSPQLKRMSAETDVSEAEIKTRKATMLPMLSARHERFWGDNYPGSITYLALTFQPGGGLSALSSMHEAESRRDAAMSSREATRKDIVDSIRADWNQVQSAQADTAVLHELVASTREVYESFVRQYSAGRKTWLDVLNARREAIQARNSLVDTQWAGVLAGLRLRINTGDLSVSSLSPAGNPGSMAANQN
ncbi:MAG: TolC family protein [Gallionellaceae bacterium]|nr:TolC family protein [Gallionellaceae bacterium]